MRSRKQDSIHGAAGRRTEGHGAENDGASRGCRIKHRAKRPNFFLLRGPPCASLLLRVKTLTFLLHFDPRPRADRQDGGQRIHGEEDVKRLPFIRRCRDVGFPIEQMRTLASLMRDPTSSCTEAVISREHPATLRAKLKALERSIASFVRNRDASRVAGPYVRGCRGAREPRRRMRSAACSRVSDRTGAAASHIFITVTN